MNGMELVTISAKDYEELQRYAARYKWLRCCTVAKFRELSHSNIVKGTRFDEMVDEEIARRMNATRANRSTP